MSASATQTAGEVSMGIKPPSHPTYDLKAVIKLALAEDAGHTGSLFTF
jgi:nicotinate-nucleotide pyrophosphorylase (carboxylating)